MDGKSQFGKGWSYEHKFGIVHVESWGKPFLVIVENKFWDGESNGYNYSSLKVEFDTFEIGKSVADNLNKEFNLPRVFNSDDSQHVLLSIQEQFPLSEISKSTTF